VCVREGGGERECVCVSMCTPRVCETIREREREKERKGESVCVREGGRERECVCVSVGMPMSLCVYARPSVSV